MYVYLTCVDVSVFAINQAKELKDRHDPVKLWDDRSELGDALFVYFPLVVMCFFAIWAVGRTAWESASLLNPELISVRVWVY